MSETSMPPRSSPAVSGLGAGDEGGDGESAGDGEAVGLGSLTLGCTVDAASALQPATAMSATTTANRSRTVDPTQGGYRVSPPARSSVAGLDELQEADVAGRLAGAREQDRGLAELFLISRRSG